jgi:tRNA (guanine-N7-)-methyltransferase
MKPKDLRWAFPCEERDLCIEDQVLYIPFYYTNDAGLFPSFSEYFGNDHPVCVEYCSGNGDWIVEKAKIYSDKNWIAVEERFDRVRKIWSKLKNLQLANLLIVFGEAATFTQFCLPDNTIEEMYINFPDPWPKPKHAKHRLMQPRFLDEVARVLKRDRRMTLVTDDLTYINQIIALFYNHGHFSPAFPSPYYRIDLPNYGHSWFDTLLRKQGKAIHYTQFVRRDADSD